MKSLSKKYLPFYSMINPITKYEIKNKLNNDLLYEDLKVILNDLEKQMLNLCQSKAEILRENLHRVILSGGKRLRPTLAYLCHRIGENDKMEIMPLMCMLELMHTASLIHDDVVDDSDERRGVTTIHKTNGIKTAVQCGDYLLAKAMEQLHFYRGTGINEALANISTSMCLGEFQQMQNLYDCKAQNKDNYFLQIKRKTAYLIATSCYTGAIAGGMSKEDAEQLRLYGEYIGIAFQLKDDLLDFMGTKIVGKPIGQDIKRGIYTLPLLHVIEMGISDKIMTLLESKNKSEKEVNTIIEYVNRSEAMNYTDFMIRKFSKEAIKALDNIEDCSEKKALIKLADTLIKRKI